jgi:FkbM family methyltransferase
MHILNKAMAADRRSLLRLATAKLFNASFSYSGSGEDRIVMAWLQTVYGLTLDRIRYCDIGANHPHKLSNTFALYQRGARGVLVEPDPDQARLLRNARPRDIVLNVGAAFDDRRMAKLKRFSNRVFNTFSEKQADLVLAREGSFNEIEIELVPTNDILSAHFDNDLHFLSIDAEGVDLAILQSIDLGRFLPKIICIEASADFDNTLKPHGYTLTARTPDNVIYRLTESL